MSETKERRESADVDEDSTPVKSKRSSVPDDEVDEENREEEKRIRQEKVKKRKEEMRKKAEQRRRQEEEEDDEVEDEQPAPKSSKPKATPAAPSKQPLRENVINNSVMFLNHPKVKTAPMSQKISYLQKKGLTQEEIQETLVRAGEPSYSTTVNNAQNQNPTYNNNPSVPPRPGNYNYNVPQPPMPQAGYPGQPYGQQMVVAPPPGWYQSRVGLALTVATCIGIGAGFTYVAKNFISPWLFKQDKKEEKQREDYQMKMMEEMQQLMKTMQQSNTDMKDYIKNQTEQQKEIVTKSLENGNKTDNGLNASRDSERMRISELEAELKKMKAMMVDNKNLGYGIPSSPTSSPYSTWNPTSNDSKIPAWQQQPRSLPQSSPAIPVASSVNTVSSTPSPSPVNVDSFKSPAKETPSPNPSTTAVGSGTDPVPKDYHQILQMVKNGQIPDDIRTDIDDKPRDNSQPIEKGERESPMKPWMKNKSNTNTRTNSKISSTDGNSDVSADSDANTNNNTKHTDSSQEQNAEPVQGESSNGTTSQ